MGTRRPFLAITIVAAFCYQLLHVRRFGSPAYCQSLFFTPAPFLRPRAAPPSNSIALRAIATSLESTTGQTEFVSPGMQVEVDFTLVRSDTAEVVDTTNGSRPLSFVCGEKQVFLGMDMAVRSIAVGETQVISMDGSSSGFGEHESAKVAGMPVKNLPAGVKVGATLQLQGAQGPHQARVVEMNETVAVLDFNHPLAGVPLTLTVTVVSCKPHQAESSQWQAQGQFVKSRTERLEKLKTQTGSGFCAVCCKPAKMRCPSCNHVLYCSEECKELHCKSLGHDETCNLANCDFQLSPSEPLESIQEAELSALDPDRFQQFRRDEGRPVLLRGALEASDWDLNSVANSFGGDTKIEIRFYRGVATTPHKWAEVGYCDSTRATVDSFVKLIRTGLAEKLDAYVNCDLAGSAADSSQLGNILKNALERISKLTGLQSTSTLGNQINIWWGPPGHTEPLHCDANDGTLLQLRGRKKVVLFPASDWLNLYPFPTSAAMSWAWSRISLQDVDVKSYPNVRKALPRRLEVTLEEGDALFIPACWAHQITGLPEDTKTSSDLPHVLSVNRFWKTDVDRTTRWLPEDVSEVFRESFPDGM